MAATRKEGWLIVGSEEDDERGPEVWGHAAFRTPERWDGMADRRVDAIADGREEHGLQFWIVRGYRPPPSRFMPSASDVLDQMKELAYDEAGEAAEDFPDVSMQAEAELNDALRGWREKHLVSCPFWIEAGEPEEIDLHPSVPVPDFRPSEVMLTVPLPFCGVMGRCEAEQAAALIVRACQLLDDVWQIVTPIQVGRTIKHDTEGKCGIFELYRNPFMRPDAYDLVKRGFARWTGDEGSDVEFTTLGYDAMRKYVVRAEPVTSDG